MITGLDWRGTAICVGSKVIYSVSSSGNIDVVEARVDAIRPHQFKSYKDRDYCMRCERIANQPDSYTYPCPGVSLVVTPLRRTGWRKTDKPKQVTLTAVERVTVIMR